MSILQKAKELGEEIASSAELTGMRDAEIAMMNDPEARSLVEEFNQKQRHFLDMKSRGEFIGEEQMREVDDLEKRVLDNPLIVDFFRKQQSFEEIIEGINKIISTAIAGGASGCSDDCCSSCSGC